MTNVPTPYSALPPTIGSLTGAEILAIDQAGTTKKTTVQNLGSALITSNFPATIEYVMDGVGTTLTTGVKGYLSVPFNCTITSAFMMGDRLGSVVVDVWKCTQGQFNAGITAPTSANSITALAPPTISSTTQYYSQALVGWTSSLGQNDVLAYNIVSVTSMQRVTLSLLCQRSLLSST